LIEVQEYGYWRIIYRDATHTIQHSPSSAAVPHSVAQPCSRHSYIVPKQKKLSLSLLLPARPFTRFL